jgi:hypothetical protein
MNLQAAHASRIIEGFLRAHQAATPPSLSAGPWQALPGDRTSRDLAQPGKGCQIMTIGQRRTCRLFGSFEEPPSQKGHAISKPNRCDPYATLQDF